MREFKFRAWRGKFKGMKYPDEYNFDGFIFNGKKDLVGLGGDKDSCDVYLENCDELILMEYTGLKDKNNNEVYEGDIISFLSDWDNEITICEIIFKYGAFIMRSKNAYYDNELFHELNNNFEVIGNIFENIDLIKNEKETK